MVWFLYRLGRFLRAGFFARLVVLVFSFALTVALVIGLLLWVVFRPVAAMAMEHDPAQPILLSPALPEASHHRAPRGVYARMTVGLPPRDPACVGLLAGNAEGDAEFFVDDAITLVAQQPDGSRVTIFKHDFRDPARDIQPLPATRLEALSGEFVALIVLLEDLTPPTHHTSDLYLLPCANVADLPNGGWPANITSAPATPTVAVGEAVPVAVAVFTDDERGPDEDAPAFWAALVGASLLVGAVGVALIHRRRRPTVPSDSSWLFIDDSDQFERLEREVWSSDLPLGVAREPLRVVPADDPEAVAVLRFAAGGLLVAEGMDERAKVLGISTSRATLRIVSPGPTSA